MTANSVTGTGPGSVTTFSRHQLTYLVNFLLRNSGNWTRVSLQGEMNGSNLVFRLHSPVHDLLLFKNGLLLTENLDYSLNASRDVITFGIDSVPYAEDVLLARDFVLATELL